MATVKKGRIGSNVKDWLKEEGLYEEVTASAIQRVVAFQIEQAIKERQLSKMTP